jgi:ferredoxin
MQNPATSAKWRRISWNIFTYVFFGQLILGLLGFEKFLMTGKLHLPVPMMIIGGPLYRGELSVMTLLFISTLVLTGPAWCSHLCYFGAIDNAIASGKKPVKGKIRNLLKFKFSLLILVFFFALVLRWLQLSLLLAAIIAGLFGVLGLFIIIFFSSKQGKMIHCLAWCPVGTIVNYLRFINPFRMYIEKDTCTLCSLCTSKCNYDALNREDILNAKPGITCTLCGDCVGSCHASSIKYRFLKLSPENSRKLYLFLTVSLHAVFLALGRI